MQWGAEVNVLEEIRASTGITPLALQSRPQVPLSGRDYINAFFTLSAARQHSMSGMQAIQMAETLAYLQLAGVDGVAQRMRYVRLLQRMDGVYLRHIAEKQKRKS